MFQRGWEVDLAASFEHQLICKIIETQDFNTVEKLGVDESFFLGDGSQTKEVFRFLREHYRHPQTFGSVPSWDLLQYRYQGFPWMGSSDTIPSLVAEVKRSKLRADLLGLIEHVNFYADKDPQAGLNVIKEAASNLSSRFEMSTDSSLSSSYERLLQNYQLVAAGKGVIGLPWPWQILNDATRGMQPGQFIIIYGRPKHGKSWLATRIGTNVYLHRKRVLVYTLEMSVPEWEERAACDIARVDFEKYQRAQLDPASYQQFFHTLQQLRAHEEQAMVEYGRYPIFYVTEPDRNTSGVSHLQAKIREIRPDLVIVDGMYLMSDDRAKVRSMDWKNVAHVSQDLKSTAKSFNIPIIGVNQAKRASNKDPKLADLDEISYADSIGQDCDLCLRAHKQKDKTSQEWEIVVSVPGARNCKLDGFVIHFVPSTNLEFKREFEDQSQQQTGSTPTPPNSPSNGSGKGGKVPLPNLSWRKP